MEVALPPPSHFDKDTIPAEFIRSEKEQPAITTFHGQVPEIPTIDLGAPDREGVIRSLVDASRDWGIFQLVNHGIPNELIQKLQEVGKQFFELPEEEKAVYAAPPDAKSIEGYGTKLQKDLEGKRSWNVHLFHKIWPPSRINYQFWPKNPTSYREVNEEYARRVREVAERVFGYLSLGLGVEESALRDGSGGEELEYMMKINYYPPCPRPDLTLGVVAHTDLSSLTILVPNEVPGLQVFKDDKWIEAKYIPNALIVHIGDQLEILSNGNYKAVLHRTTVSKDHVRMSWPVFVEPPLELEVGPLQKLIDQENPAKFKSKKFKDFMHCKLNKLPQ